MKYFLIRLLYLIPFFGIISIVNYTVDVNNFLNLEIIDQSVLWVKEGNSVARIHRYHGRYFNKKYIEQSEKSKEVIVLGSSKADKIGNALFPNNSFYNFFLADATIFESLSFFQLLEETGSYPKRIILEINPHSFRVKPKPTEMLLGENYNKMLTLLEEEDQKIAFIKAKQIVIDLKQLFSANYFMVNITTKKKPPFITTDSIGKRLVLKDGSSAREHYFEPDITNILVRKEVRNLATEIAKPYKEEKIILQNFLKYLTEVKNIEVSLFVLPIHPDVYKHQEMQQAINKWNDYLSFLNMNYEVEIIGGLNPTDFDLKKTSYVDVVHVNKASFAQIFKLHRKNKEIQGIN